MTAEASSRPNRAPAAPERLIVIPLLAFLALLPPETRWESMLAVSLCGSLFVLAAWLRPAAPPVRATILAGCVLALVLVGTAPAPAAGVAPVALFVLATGVGLAATGPGLGRSGPRVAYTLAALGGVVSLHAIYQKLWGLEALALRFAAETSLPDQHALLERTVAGRAFANFSTPAALGGYLVLVLPVTVMLAATRRPGGSEPGHSRTRYVLWGLALLQLGGLAATASASSTAALIGILALAAVFWGRARGAIGLAVGVLALLLVAVVAFRGSKMVSPTDPNSPWRLRAGNYRSAALMALEHPWRGVGPGGVAEHYPTYRRPGDNETRHVHNLPLEFAAELGICGGLIGGGALLYVFLLPLAQARKHDEPWRRGLALGLGTFALHNLADYTAFMPSMLLTAVLVRGVIGAREEEAVAPQGPFGRTVAAATGVAVVAAATLLALQSLADDARFRGRVAAFAGEHAQAEELAHRATALAPWDVGAALFEARAVARDAGSASSARREDSLRLAERAVRLSPVNPGARETRAMARMYVGDYPGAYADLVEAAELYPLEPRYVESRDALRRRLPSPSTGAPEAGSSPAPPAEGS